MNCESDSETIVSFSINPSNGDQLQIRVAYSSVFNGTNTLGSKGSEGGGQTAAGIAVPLICSTSQTPTPEPAAITQVDPMTRVMGKTGRDIVYALPIMPETAGVNSYGGGTYTGGTSGGPQLGTGAGQPLTSNGEVGAYGLVQNGSTPLVFEDQRIKMLSQAINVTDTASVPRNYTYPWLTSKGAFDFYGGLLEIKLALGAYNLGMVPAVWCLGRHSDMNEEVDIGEFNLGEHLLWTQTSHFNAAYDVAGAANYNAPTQSSIGTLRPEYCYLGNDGDLVIMTLDWSVDANGKRWLSVLYDGILLWQQSDAVGIFNTTTGTFQPQPLYWIVSSAVGGNVALGIDNTILGAQPWPGSMWIEDVRVYQSATERTLDGSVKDLYGLPHNAVVASPPLRNLHLYPYPSNVTAYTAGAGTLKLRYRAAYGTAPYNVVVNLTSAPAGVTANNQSGLASASIYPVTGNATTSGTLAGTVTVTDVNGLTAASNFSVAVTAPFVPTSLGGKMFSSHDSAHVTIDGATGKLTAFASTDGSLQATIHSEIVMVQPDDGLPAFYGLNGGYIDTGLVISNGAFTLAVVGGQCSDWLLGGSDLTGISLRNYNHATNSCQLFIGDGSPLELDADTYHAAPVVVWRYDPATAILDGRWNGKQFYHQNIGAKSFSSTATLNIFRGNGAISGNSGFFDQLYVVSGVLSDANTQKVEGAMAWAGSRGGDLVAGHPYQGAAPTA